MRYNRPPACPVAVVGTKPAKGCRAPLPIERWTPPGRTIAYHDLMERTEHRFVVRVWLETAGPEGGQWRGVVDHVGTGRKLYFSSMGDLMDFLRLRMTEAPKAPTAGPKT